MVGEGDTLAYWRRSLGSGGVCSAAISRNAGEACGAQFCGNAAGETADMATKRGILELIERDAVMRWWRLGSQFQRVRPGDVSVPPWLWEAAERDRAAGWRTEVFLGNGAAIGAGEFMDIPVWVVVSRSLIEPWYTVGACAGRDDDLGVAHAFSEAVQQRLLKRLLGNRPDQIKTFHDHLLFYWNRENVKIVDEFFGGRGHQGLDGSDHRGGTSGSDRRRAGHVAVMDLAKCASGGSIVRVLATGLFTMEAEDAWGASAVAGSRRKGAT